MAVPQSLNGKYTPQFKNTVISLAQEAAVLTPNDPEVAVRIFGEILAEITRIKYYKSKKFRRSPPRASKKPINKWQQDKAKKMVMA